jgi:hypothetical protein
MAKRKEVEKQKEALNLLKGEDKHEDYLDYLVVSRIGLSLNQGFLDQGAEFSAAFHFPVT